MTAGSDPRVQNVDEMVIDESAAPRRADWYRYYSAKRIGQLFSQMRMLGDLPVRRLLEVGPHKGLVTAMAENLGLDVTTLDIGPRGFERPDVPHTMADLIGIDAERIAGFDAIICCETLEHLPWHEVSHVLRAFRASGARYLIVSVPYEGFQIEFSLYLNWHAFRHYFSWKKLRALKSFVPEAGPDGHKWEVGYRRFGLGTWEAKLAAADWLIRQREFTYPTRTVMHLLERADG